MTVIILGALLVAAAALIGWLAYQLLAQNGRILARLEALERQIECGSSTPSGSDADAREQSLKKSRLLRTGLPEGTVAPEFHLPRVGGGELALSQYRGRKVLVLFSDPACGPCSALLPELQQRYAAGSELSLLMVSRGDLEANAAKVAAHGLTFPVVLQRGWEVSRQYGMFATPIAFLVDEDGTIAAPVAVGAQRILELIPAKRPHGSWFRPRPRPAQT